LPRNKDIRKAIAPIIEELCQVYEDTNPALGDEAEWEKLQSAQYSFDLFWQLYGKLMIWAQNQIVGYEQARDDNEVAELVALISSNGQIHDNVHGFELLGASMTMRRSYGKKDIEEKFNFIVNHLETDISDSALRKAYIKMLLSDDKASQPVRSRLQYALEAVEHGEAAELFKPSRTRRKGSPYALDQTKSMIIMHLCYLEAKGIKTYKALEMIGQDIAASPETIRTWKKELVDKDWFRFQWDCGRIAGQYEDVLLSEVDDGSDEGVLAHEAEEYGPFLNIELSMEFLRYKANTYSLETLREQLKKHRQ